MAFLPKSLHGQYCCNSPHWSLLLMLISFLNQLINSSSLIPSSNSTYNSCLHDQSSALLQFKSSFSIDEYVTHSNLWSWKPNTNCCSWDGVTCDDFGFVIGLDVSESGLFGSISSSNSLFKLHHLKTLNLAYNDFNSSSIPTAFVHLHSLTHLNLSNSDFSGQVPPEISQLTSLISLDLSFMYLVLQSPNLNILLKNMSSLRELRLDRSNLTMPGWDQVISSPLLHILQVLSLSNCGLSGPMMSSSLLNLSSLTVLDLSQNNITHFPTDMFHLPNLLVLDLSRNDLLTGSLPEFRSSSLQELVLSGTKFSGTIPQSIGNLKMLTKLDLSQCEFYGSIPSSLWDSLDQLMFLDLGYNNFSGEIFSFNSFSNLSHLERLFLWHNNFSGLLPSIKSSSKTIQQVYLSYNRFTGPIHDSYVDGLPNLQTLHLSNNLLTGPLPSSLFTKLPSLEILGLSNNQFSGELEEFARPASSQLFEIGLCDNMLEGRIPTSFSKLSSLQNLLLCSNRFQGVLDPHMFESMSNLTTIDFSYNRMLSIGPIDGVFNMPNFFRFSFSYCNLTEFPRFLKHQEKLEILDLSNNQLQGKMPMWLWNGSRTLNLSGNLLDDFEQPAPDPSSSMLRILDLRSNMFNGPIPDLPTTLLYLLLSDNNFIQVPMSICNLSQLTLLDLSGNQISGSIPPCLGKLMNLNVLDLSKNKFSGSIRQEFDKFCTLSILNMNGNQLEGILPRSLTNCLHLEILDLGNNQINDTFPFWLESLKDLQVLMLQSNRFHDSISGYHPPSNNISFPNLHIIDLSFNSFTGHLPLQYFQSSKAMTTASEGGDKYQVQLGFVDDTYYGYSLMVANKGQELSYAYKILYILNAVDFSSNKFQGEIPELIGDFKSIAVLNLSHNSLGGKIPSSLGNLRELQSLDLSDNDLLGEIPPELTSLTFLSVLNVSRNHLVGRIPSGAQFQTFSSRSFEGNLGLCGSPLPIECNQQSDNAPPSSSSSSEEPESQENLSSTTFDWKFALAGYGSGLVIGVVIEHFLLSRNMYYLGKIMNIERFILGNKMLRFPQKRRRI